MEVGFRHEALIYAGEDDFLAVTAPFIRGALEAGEPALVAVGSTNTSLLEGELGKDAAWVLFTDMEALGRNPARIIPFWRDFVDEHGGQSVCGVGEPVWPGRGAAEIDECQRHESLLNVAFSPQPSWSLLCPYDARSLEDEVLEKIAHSHRHLVRDGVAEEGAHHAAESGYFEGHLPDSPSDTVSFEFDRTQLADVRRWVERAAEDAEMPAQDTADLVVSAGELAANSIVHGGGAGALRVWREAGRLVVEVEDRGSIKEPLVGRLRPKPTQQGGRGLWIANQLCDLVQIRSGPRGTTVRLQMDIE